MKKLLNIGLIIVFLFLAENAAAFKIFAPQRVEFFLTQNKLSDTLKIWNNGKEPVICGVKLTPQVVDKDGSRIESENETKFCEAITLSDLIFELPPSSEPRALRLALNLRKLNETEQQKDHYATLYIYEIPQKRSKTETGAVALQSEGIPVFFFANEPREMEGKGIVEVKSGDERNIVSIKSIRRHILFGSLVIYSILDNGTEKQIYQDATFRVITERDIKIKSDTKKIRVEFKGMYPPHPIIVNETLSLSSYREGFFPLIVNRQSLAEMFPVLIKDQREISEKKEIFADIRELNKILEFWFKEERGVIKGTIFGKKEWYEINIATKDAKSYAIAPFSISCYGYWINLEDLSRLFGVDIKYDSSEAVIRVRSPSRKKFAFELREKLADKIERSKKRVSTSYSSNLSLKKSQIDNLFALKTDYSLWHFQREREKNSCANFNFAMNYSNLIFAANQKISSRGSTLEGVKLSYYNQSLGTLSNYGEIDRFLKDPASREYAHGKGFEIMTLRSDEKFPFAASALIPRSASPSEAYFINGKYIEPAGNDIIFLSKGRNSITRRYISEYGDEIIEMLPKIIPKDYPGNEFSFYTGIIQPEGNNDIIHHSKLNYGNKGKLFTLGSASEQFYVYSEYPYSNLFLKASLGSTGKFNFSCSTINLRPSATIYSSNNNISLAAHEKIREISLSGDLCFYKRKDGEWKNEERFSIGLSPLRRINCSFSALRKEEKLSEAAAKIFFRRRNHRFEVSLRKNFCFNPEYIPYIGYNYSCRKVNFTVYGYGEQFNTLAFNFAYYLENFGRMSQSFQHNVETGNLTANSRWSGSIIATADSIDFSARPTVNQAKILARVFLDKNYNGDFDLNDELLENVKLTIDGKPSRYATGKNGTAWINVPAPKKLYVGADAGTLPNINAVPDTDILIDMVAPTTFKIEIPVYLTAKIMGTAENEKIVKLVNAKSRELIIKTDVLGGGIFYFNKVIPGEYLLIGDSCEKRITVGVDDYGDPVSILDITLGGKDE